jgi:alkylated DNA repair protein alkB homolog 1
LDLTHAISLGNAAIFLIGGLTRDIQPTPILLRSGDVVIMSGPECRRAYHGARCFFAHKLWLTFNRSLKGVPRILEATLPPHLHASDDDYDWKPYEKYMCSTRINVNVRQVFPKGFHPSLDMDLSG